MPPVLYQRLTRQDALASFRAARPDPTAGGDAFTVLEGEILAFVVLSDGERASRFRTPTVLEWRPDEGGGLPGAAAAAEEAGHSRKRFQLFVRRPQDPDFLYVGPARLTAHGVSRGASGAEFELAAKLPRDRWVDVGGHPGWLVTVDHTERRLEAADAAAFEQVLDELASRSDAHLSLTRYEDDALHLFVSREDAWLMYLRTPEDSGLYVESRRAASRRGATARFRCDCGIALEFPIEQTLPRADGLAAAREFFRTARVPAGLNWREG